MRWPGRGTPRRLNATRRAMLWWFGPPQLAHLNATVSVDVGAALAYLARLNAGEGPRVSLTHLVAAAIVRALAEHPKANARVVGGRIFDPGFVGIAMPVSLEGHAGERHGELSLTVVPDVGGLSLRALAARTTRAVRAERGGAQQSGAVRFVFVATNGRLRRPVAEGPSRPHRQPPRLLARSGDWAAMPAGPPVRLWAHRSAEATGSGGGLLVVYIASPAAAPEAQAQCRL